MTFHAEAAIGQDVDILTHGPLTLFLLCRAELAALGVRTAADGTMITTQSPHMFGPGGVDAVSIMVARPPVTENGSRVGYVTANEQLDGIGGVSVITPDGLTLTVPVDSVGFGVQLHSHPDVGGTAWEDAPDCFVTGHALLSMMR